MMRDELHRLKTKDRYEVIAAIAEARSHGDLSENAEYDAAKERQAFIEGRIAELESKLSSAQIIDPKTLNTNGRVVFAATVSLEDLESGEKVSYQIVGNDEADLKAMSLKSTRPPESANMKFLMYCLSEIVFIGRVPFSWHSSGGFSCV